jgi:uncharacterized membrane protein
MLTLVIGLVVFLGAHSVRIVAEPWRNDQIARLGEGTWKGLYSLVSLAGLVLIVWGYGQARLEPVVLWNPPVWSRHAAAALMLPAFVLIAAGNLRGTRMKRAFGHPMVLGVKVWAFAHLLANGMLADVVLFGSFLAWAVVDYRTARRRDRAMGVTYPQGALSRDLIAVVIGIAAWAAFAFWLHLWLFGVRPLAG